MLCPACCGYLRVVIFVLIPSKAAPVRQITLYRRQHEVSANTLLGKCFTVTSGAEITGHAETAAIQQAATQQP